MKGLNTKFIKSQVKVKFSYDTRCIMVEEDFEQMLLNEIGRQKLEAQNFWQ